MVIHRNGEFARSTYKPWKVGSLIGIEKRFEDNRRMGLNPKSRNFETVNRMAFLMRGTAAEFKEWLEAK